MDINRTSNLFQEVEPSLIKKIFQETQITDELIAITLLNGGLFNTTYKVKTAAETYIIRFSPVNQHLLMGFEKNLMIAENHVYSLCKAHQISCPKVIACDTSRKLLDRDYMITSYIPGTVMSNATLAEHEKSLLFESVGKYAASLHAITSDRFGFVSRILTKQQTYSWSECLIREVKEILSALEYKSCFSTDEVACILNVFMRNQCLLDEIKTPHLLHTDLWEGNFIISYNDKKPFLKTVIDGDRAVFGDIDFEWAAPWMNIPAIQKGAGIIKENFLTPSRMKRRNIYRIFYALINCYVGAVEYNDWNMFYEGKKEVLYNEEVELS